MKALTIALTMLVLAACGGGSAEDCTLTCTTDSTWSKGVGTWTCPSGVWRVTVIGVTGFATFEAPGCTQKTVKWADSPASACLQWRYPSWFVVGDETCP